MAASQGGCRAIAASSAASAGFWWHLLHHQRHCGVIGGIVGGIFSDIRGIRCSSRNGGTVGGIIEGIVATWRRRLRHSLHHQRRCPNIAAWLEASGACFGALWHRQRHQRHVWGHGGIVGGMCRGLAASLGALRHRSRHHLNLLIIVLADSTDMLQPREDIQNTPTTTKNTFSTSLLLLLSQKRGSLEKCVSCG